MSETETLYGFKVREPDLRRVPHEERKVYDIKQLWQRQHEILNLALLGHKYTEIAEMLGITPATVSATLNSTLGREAIAEKRKSRDEEYIKFHEKIMNLTEESFKVYNEILQDPSESRKLKKETADTITLDLAGLRAPTKIDSRSMNFTLSAEDIEEFKKRGMAAAESAGRVIDIEDN